MAATQSGDSGNGTARSERNEQMKTEQDDIMDQDNDHDTPPEEILDISAEQTGIDSGTSDDTGNEAESVTLAPFSPQLPDDEQTQRLIANEPPFERLTVEKRYDKALKGRLNSSK